MAVAPQPQISHGLPRASDEELLRLTPQELVRRLRRCETDNLKLLMDHGSLMKELNRNMQVNMLEIHSLKEANQRLLTDNQELRDLCCFLDDDRQKGRRLAREWQRFGRYTAGVMRQEVASYHNKLRQLEAKQHELVHDNLELKELCLYLDDERSRITCLQCGSTRREDTSSANHSVLNEQVLQYIRKLESHIQLPEDKFHKQLATDKQSSSSGCSSRGDCGSVSSQGDGETSLTRPEAVIQAMKVLEVHDQLDKTEDDSSELDSLLAEGEKALVREMCNVVWRKLDNGSV